MAGAPTGTVTFLFTDIQGSTRLLQHLGDRYVDVLGDYRRLLRAAIQKGNGHEVDTQGDAFFVAFPRARDALAAAVEAQKSFFAYPWPEQASLRVRMGLHTGEPPTTEMGYVGLDVHRAARICSTGHGGQILLSQTTRDLIECDLPGGVGLRDLGQHRLKDLAQAQHLFQVLIADLPTDFPPLKSLDTLPNNLPRQLSSFVGREKEMTEITQLLATTRLLAVTGAGGCGKTRLALQVAADILEEYPEGVWLVELASLTNPGLVLQTVASTLGLREEPGRSLLSTVLDFAGPRKLLLMLDNCEHLLLACAQLAEALLHACPHLRLLATSREPLGVDGELVYRVPSLSLPNPKRPPSSEDLLQDEAVRLFAVRAAHSRPGFTVTRDNWGAVVEVCRRLDGIPLAIELAAARVHVLSVEQIESRLNDRFRLLTGGSRTRLPRQQTLRAVMDWSYHLLSEKEQTMMRRLSVFAGSWTLEAAEAACAEDGIESFEVLDLIAQLALKSLVLVEEQGSDTRYRFLETVRQYGLEMLRGSEELKTMRRRHRDFFLALAEGAKPKLRGTDQGIWLKRLETEHDNLRVALEWSLESEEVEAGLRLAGALARFWEVRGYLAEGRERLATVLSRPGAAEPIAVRAEALMGAGILAWRQGDYPAARALYEELRKSGDLLGVARALNSLGLVAREQGDYTTARALHEESLAIRRGLGDTLGVSLVLNNLGLVATAEGAYASANSYYAESLKLKRELGDKLGIAYVLNNLGDVAYNQGDYTSARSLYEQSLAIKRELEDDWGVAYALNNLGDVACHQGDYASAHALYRESLAMKRELGDKLGIAECLEGIAGLAGAQGEAARSTRLFGAAEALREAMGAPLSPSDRSSYDRDVSEARAGLDEDTFVAAWASGREMTLAQAVDFALRGEAPDVNLANTHERV